MVQPDAAGRTGVAAYSAELVRGLSGSFQIDVFVDASRHAPAPGTRSAHDFVWLHQQNPYDLTVYQLGNSAVHEYMWPYLFRYPGLTVLHDAHLHHARAAALLTSGRTADYRAEFTANHPDRNPDLAELAVPAIDSYLYYYWPMTRLVVERSRLTAVHTAAIARELRQDVPGARIETIRLGHGVEIADEEAERLRRRIRARYGIAPEALVFGCFGGLTPEKRLPQVCRRLPPPPSSSSRAAPARGRGAGPLRPRRGHRAFGVGDRTVITGYVERTRSSRSTSPRATSPSTCGGRRRAKSPGRGCAAWPPESRP